MPSATSPKPSYPHITERVRVVHSPYGRGVVHSVDRKHGYAGVQFDGEDATRHVPMSRLVVEPTGMPKGLDDPMPFVRRPFEIVPPYRQVWPLDAVAGEGEV